MATLNYFQGSTALVVGGVVHTNSAQLNGELCYDRFLNSEAHVSLIVLEG